MVQSRRAYILLQMSVLILENLGRCMKKKETTKANTMRCYYKLWTFNWTIGHGSFIESCGVNKYPCGEIDRLSRQDKITLWIKYRPSNLIYLLKLKVYLGKSLFIFCYLISHDIPKANF